MLSKFRSNLLRAMKSISQTFHPSLTSLPLRTCAAPMVKSSLCESLPTIMETTSDWQLLGSGTSTLCKGL
eukprot:UN27907